MNLLGILPEHYGMQGIYVGNLISQNLTVSGFKAQYDLNSRKIVILNSSKLSYSEFSVRLGFEKAGDYSIYKGWYPQLNKEKNKDGNLTISLLPKPATSSSYLPLPDLSLPDVAKALEKQQQDLRITESLKQLKVAQLTKLEQQVIVIIALTLFGFKIENKS